MNRIIVSLELTATCVMEPADKSIGLPLSVDTLVITLTDGRVIDSWEALLEEVERLAVERAGEPK